MKEIRIAKTDAASVTNNVFGLSPPLNLILPTMNLMPPRRTMIPRPDTCRSGYLRAASILYGLEGSYHD